MDIYTITRIVHVIARVFWIGGVAMVPTVILPAVNKMVSKQERIDTFEKIEGWFAMQAKISTVLTGLSGFYMIYYIDG